MQATRTVAEPTDAVQKRTFTENARRAQIVAAAIATICELGYRKASFAQIARRARLSSTGLISYHFGSRDELIGQVVSDVVTSIGSHMTRRLAGVSSAREALRTYIEGNIEFIGEHRQEMKALLEIFLNGGFGYGPGADRAVVAPVEQILRDGRPYRGVS